MAYTNMISGSGSHKYVVTGTEYGPFNTIQSAIAQVVIDVAAGSVALPQLVYVRPGTYTENLVLVNGINIEGSEEGAVDIVGVHTPPAAGTVTISNCKLSSVTDIFNSAVAGTTAITLRGCQFNITSGYVFNLINWVGDLYIDDCTEISADNGIIMNLTGCSLDVVDSAIGAFATLTMTVAGPTRIYNSSIYCNILASGNSALVAEGGSFIEGSMTTADNALVSVYNSHIDSGIDSAIVHNSAAILRLENVVINSTNATCIDGAGTVSFGEVVYNQSNTVAVTIAKDNTTVLQASNILANQSIEVANGDMSITNGALVLGVSGGLNGQVPIATTAGNPAWGSITSTDGTINVALGAGTIDLSSAGGANWQVATVATAMAATDGYITKIAIPGMLSYTLPAVAGLGTILEVTGYSAGMWRILQGAGQQVHFGNVDSTLGAGGSITATNRYDSIRLLCVVANLEWNVLSSTGVFNIV